MDGVQWTLIDRNSAVLTILYFNALLKMPLKEWNYFNKGEKNNSIHFWAQCKATNCDAKIAGMNEGIVVHIKWCNYLEEGIREEYQNTKRKLTQQAFHVVNSYSAPITKTEYDEMQT